MTPFLTQANDAQWREKAARFQREAAAGLRFHPVMELPECVEVYDFTQSYDPGRALLQPFGIGKYDERRTAAMYQQPLFGAAALSGEGGHQDRREVHMGIDLGAPEGTPVYAFYDGVIYGAAIHQQSGDYGGTVITQHWLGGGVGAGLSVWALYGHLSHASVHAARKRRFTTRTIAAGECLGWVGVREENGGWNPHLHFQLSLEEPRNCDLPGVVSLRERELARLKFPDPRLVLGPLYPFDCGSLKKTSQNEG